MPEDFNARAVAMVEAVTALDVGTLPALRSGLKRLGETCSACHKSYRVKK